MQLSLALAYKSDGEASSRISKETRFQNICLPSAFGLCPAQINMMRLTLVILWCLSSGFIYLFWCFFLVKGLKPRRKTLLCLTGNQQLFTFINTANQHVPLPSHSQKCWSSTLVAEVVSICVSLLHELYFEFLSVWTLFYLVFLRFLYTDAIVISDLTSCVCVWYSTWATGCISMQFMLHVNNPIMAYSIMPLPSYLSGLKYIYKVILLFTKIQDIHIYLAVLCMVCILMLVWV